MMIYNTRDSEQKRHILIYLASLVTVWQVAVSGESSGSEGFAWIWVLWALNNHKLKFCCIITHLKTFVEAYHPKASVEH